MSKGFFIPETIDPDVLACVQFKIPNDALYRQAVRGHIWTLGSSYYWNSQDSQNEDALATADLFMNTLFDSLEIKDDCDTGTGLGSCFRLDTTTDAFSYYPNDPFTDPANADGSPIFTGLKWKRWAEIGVNSIPLIGDLIQGASELITGYFPNDIILTLDNFEVLNPIERLQDFIGAFTQFPFPYVRIELEGSGQIEIELLNFPMGCIAMLIPDLPVDENLNPQWGDVFDTIVGFIDDGLDIPKGWISLELNRVVPIQLYVSQIQEFDFDEYGVHTLHAFFIPRPSIEPPFLNLFGGIREIEACGEIKVIGVTTGNEIDITNHREPTNGRNGVMSMTLSYDEFCEAVRCGNIKALEEMASRVAFGAVDDNYVSDISIGKDGAGVKKSAGYGVGGSLEDSNAGNDEIVYGGSLGVGEGFRDFVGEIILRKDTQSRTKEDVANILRKFFVLEPIVDSVDAIIDLLDDLAGTPYTKATDEVTPAVIPSAVAGHIYCGGPYKSSLQRYAIAVQDSAGTDAQHIGEWYSLLIEQLTDEQIQSWFASGVNTPRFGFESAPCYRQSSIVAIVTYPQYNSGSNGIKKFVENQLGNRKWRLELNDKLVNADGDEYDGVYLKLADGTLTRNHIQLGKSLVTTTSSTNNPSYNSQSSYALEYNATFVADMVRFTQSFTPISGQIVLKLIDLGAS